MNFVAKNLGLDPKHYFFGKRQDTVLNIENYDTPEKDKTMSTGTAVNKSRKVSLYKTKIHEFSFIRTGFVPMVLETTSVPDPYVFGPPGYESGSVSHKYGSGHFPFLIKC
jgi:hypothetical protein